MATGLRRILVLSGLLSILCASALAQERASTAPAVDSQQSRAVSHPLAPQVGAVVHRISGFKMLNLLKRKGVKVAPLDDETLISDDLHTSIAASLSLEDGSVVARLPQAELEIPLQLSAALSNGSAPEPVKPSDSTMVVYHNGRQLPAMFIGLDGGTGLALLRVDGLTAGPARDAREDTLVLGQKVRLLAPQGVPQIAGLISDQLYLNINELEGNLTEITRASAGNITRLAVRAGKLSPAVVGGIAINEAGETIGLVQSSGFGEAYVIPIAAVRRAIKRIRLTVENKPQPWLGARGEAVAATSLEQLMLVGWNRLAASKLLGSRYGVLLTSVPPQTPAWFGSLRAGDVVTRVNAGDVKGAEDFSSLLKDAGSDIPVRFTVLRPDQRAPRVVTFKLNESLNPVRDMEAAEALAARRQSADPLVARGVETISITPKLAFNLKAQGGLLVVSVHPQSPGARAGLLAGDVIEAIDGKLLSRNSLPPTLPAQISLSVIRAGRKLEVKLNTSSDSPDTRPATAPLQ